MTLILLCHERLPTIRDTEGGQRHAPSEYCIPRSVEACAVGGVRAAGRGARGRLSGAPADDEEPADSPAVWPAVGGDEPARGRNRAAEPCGAALSSWCQAGAAFDAVRRQRVAAERGIQRAAGGADEAGSPRTAAQDG